MKNDCVNRKVGNEKYGVDESFNEAVKHLMSYKEYQYATIRGLINKLIFMGKTARVNYFGREKDPYFDKMDDEAKAFIAGMIEYFNRDIKMEPPAWVFDDAYVMNSVFATKAAQDIFKNLKYNKSVAKIVIEDSLNKSPIEFKKRNIICDDWLENFQVRKIVLDHDFRNKMVVLNYDGREEYHLLVDQNEKPLMRVDRYNQLVIIINIDCRINIVKLFIHRSGEVIYNIDAYDLDSYNEIKDAVEISGGIFE